MTKVDGETNSFKYINNTMLLLWYFVGFIVCEDSHSFQCDRNIKNKRGKQMQNYFKIFIRQMILDDQVTPSFTFFKSIFICVFLPPKWKFLQQFQQTAM